MAEKSRIEELSSAIRYHRELYYNHSAPEISDADFDNPSMSKEAGDSDEDDSPNKNNRPCSGQDTLHMQVKEHKIEPGQICGWSPSGVQWFNSGICTFQKED